MVLFMRLKGKGHSSWAVSKIFFPWQGVVSWKREVKPAVPDDNEITVVLPYIRSIFKINREIRKVLDENLGQNQSGTRIEEWQQTDMQAAKTFTWGTELTAVQLHEEGNGV